jgi:hypothetical protein
VGALSDGSVEEYIGASTPVVTPFSLGVKNGTLGSRPWVSECRSEDGALGGQEFVDSLFGEVEHLV